MTSAPRPTDGPAAVCGSAQAGPVGGSDRPAPEALARLAAEGFARAWSADQFAAELDASGGRLWWEGPVAAPRACLLGHQVHDELEIRSLVVARADRLRGRAGQLLARALAEAARDGVRVVHLEVRDANAAARALYAGAGFCEVGRRRGYYPDGEDALLLSRVLAAAEDGK